MDDTKDYLGFLFSFDGAFNDYEAIDEEELDVDALLGRQIPAGHFRGVGMHGSGSMIALWRVDPSTPWAEAPAVWLDSEGEPMAPIARSHGELLALLTMDTGAIYDALKEALRPRSKGRGWNKRTAAEIEAAADDYEDHPSYVAAIRELGVKPLFNAFDVVKAAVAEHGTVTAWAQGFPPA